MLAVHKNLIYIDVQKNMILFLRLFYFYLSFGFMN